MRVQLILDAVDKASRVISGVGRAIDRLRGATGRGFSMMGAGALRAGENIATLGAAAGAYAGAVSGLGVALLGPSRQFERFQAVLETTEGSAAAARAAMDWVGEFATRTPYELDQVMESFVQLRSYGLDPTAGLLTSLGDASAAMNKPLIQAVEAVADAVMGENERLKELGITASKVGQYFEYVYTDAAGVQRKLRAAANDRLAIQRAIQQIFDEKYSGAMERLSRTFDGILSNLSDAWANFVRAIGEAGLFDFAKDRAQELLDTVNAMAESGELQALARTISDNLVEGLKIAWEMAQGAADALMVLGAWLSAAAEALGGWNRLAIALIAIPLIPTIVGVAAGLIQIAAGLAFVIRGALGLIGPLRMLAIAAVRFGVALMTTPIGWIIAGLALLAGAAWLVYDNWESIGPMLAAVWEWVKTAWSQAWTALLRILADAWAAVRDTAVAFWTGLVEWMGGVGDAAVAALAGGWDGLTDWAGSLWVGAGDAIRAGWDAIAAWFGNIAWPQLPPLPDIAALVDDAFGPVIETLDKWWSAIGAKMGEWSETISAWFGSIRETIGSVDFGSWFSGAETLGDALPSDPRALAAVAEQTAVIEASVSAIAGTDAARILTDLDAAARGADLTGKAIDALAPAADAAAGAVTSVFSAMDLTGQGVRLMETLAAGIRAGASAAVAAVAETAGAIRDHLPHSPAKVGPLDDLDQVRFGETLAGAVRQGMPAAVAAVAAVAGAMASALAVPSLAMPGGAGRAAGAGPGFGAAGVAAALPGGPREPAASTRGAVSASITFAPTIQSAGAGPDDIRRVLAGLGPEITALVERELARRQRREH